MPLVLQTQPSKQNYYLINNLIYNSHIHNHKQVLKSHEGYSKNKSAFNSN